MRTGRLRACVENEKWKERAGLTGVFPRCWRAKRVLHSCTRRDGDLWGGLEGLTPLPIAPTGRKRARRREGLQGWPAPEEYQCRTWIMGNGLLWG